MRCVSCIQDAADIDLIRQKFVALDAVMDERLRRQWAAAEAAAYGWGGISAVAVATGLARNTIAAGARELHAQAENPSQPISPWLRRPGAGRKLLIEKDQALEHALDSLIDPVTRGDPMSPLRWTCKSTRKLAAELRRQNHPVGERTVATLLRLAGYSLQGNRKTREGTSHPDRNAQFEYIHGRVLRYQRRGQPVVSVDTKKKELVGDFKGSGEEWQPAGKPEEVRMHDFPDRNLGKAVPYGVYDLTSNEGWVSVGINHDTADFAAATIRRWWEEMGCLRFPQATELLITADGGGSNSSRSRLWKVALQGLADTIGLRLHVCHFPPGTSKWNKIEHRLFCFLTKNWRGRPLVNYATIVNLISHTTTAQGLVVRAALDQHQYETGKKVSDDELAKLKLTKADFHGEWNYTIKPRP
jgi:hypothetical protein